MYIGLRVLRNIKFNIESACAVPPRDQDSRDKVCYIFGRSLGFRLYCLAAEVRFYELVLLHRIIHVFQVHVLSGRLIHGLISPSGYYFRSIKLAVDVSINDGRRVKYEA